MKASSDYISVGLLDLGKALAVLEGGNDLGLQVFDLLQLRKRDEWKIVVKKFVALRENGG